MMTATTHSLSSPRHGQLRPLSLQRDLSAVADLVELCFADTLDADGRRYIRQMRSAANSPHKIGVPGRISPSFTGFIWEENAEIVGNLNLLPVVAEGRQTYLIANVAVHPNYRRQGIASALTEAGIDFIRAKGGETAWLQANADNPTAIRLYQGFGFIERARRTTWHSPDEGVLIQLPEGVQVRGRRRKEWPQQRAWLARSYPDDVRWHLALRPSYFNPGLRGRIREMFSDRRFQHWSACRDGNLIGVLSWQSSYTQADWLWLAAALEHEELAICALLTHAQEELSKRAFGGRRRTLAVNYPAGLGAEAFKAAGFEPHQTLIWMQNQVG